VNCSHSWFDGKAARERRHVPSFDCEQRLPTASSGASWTAGGCREWPKTPQDSALSVMLPVQKESAQVLTPSRNDNRQRTMADAGGKRRRPDSNRGWRICNQTPGQPNDKADNELRNEPDSVGPEMGPVTENLPTVDPDLAALIDAWPALPEPVKVGIVAMVRAASKSEAEGQ